MDRTASLQKADGEINCIRRDRFRIENTHGIRFWYPTVEGRPKELFKHLFVKSIGKPEANYRGDAYKKHSISSKNVADPL